MTDANTRDPFTELHQKGDHSIEWRFAVTLPVCAADVHVEAWFALLHRQLEAVKAATVVNKLIKTIDTSLPGKVYHQINMLGVWFSTKSKKDFDLVNAIVRAVLADVDPDAFAAEIKTAAEAALAAQDRKVEAETRADALLGVALSARESVHRTAMEKAEEAFADEIDALRGRYNVLVEKFVERCQQEAARIVADVEEFADCGVDAQAVFDLTNEIVAAQPLKFSGPSILLGEQRVRVVLPGPNRTRFDEHLRIRDALVNKLLIRE